MEIHSARIHFPDLLMGNRLGVGKYLQVFGPRGRSAPCAHCEIARNTKEYQGILNEGAPVEPQSRVQLRRGQYFYSSLIQHLMKILQSPNAFAFYS